ncbi:MAG TPA: hypothetical protein VMR95_04375 [Candidatus Binatia bacterium]|nr:hypothetical protein [Candidatus Binatia bacterium]
MDYESKQWPSAPLHAMYGANSHRKIAVGAGALRRVIINHSTK